jgi:hypothetical protein
LNPITGFGGDRSLAEQPGDAVQVRATIAMLRR